MADTDRPGGATSDPSSKGGLSKGDTIAGARLVEPMARGERIVCWRAVRSDGEPATVHALTGAVHPREKDNFLKGARKLAVLTRNQPLEGIVDPVTVVPNIPAYIARGGTAGTMEDVTILGWGVRETVAFIKRLCRALGTLHEHAIAHGCLRPANVLLDDDLRPRLSDVGMLVIDDSYDGPSDMKHDYAAYAAREVRLGKKADARSDVFSVGRLLYFALHGEEPDEPDDDTPLLAALEHAPPGLVRIIRRCTLRSPEGRYASVGELLRDLERWREADEVGIRHPNGKEGAQADESSSPGDSDPPSYPNEPSRSSRPPDSVRPPSPEERKPPEVPIRSYHAPPRADDDPLTPLQSRVGGAIGALIICGALLQAYYTGVASNAAVIGSIVGAVALSLSFPPIAAPVASRLLNAVVLALVAWFIDPASVLAARGRDARLATGTPQARGVEVARLKARGVRDLSGVALRGVDFKRLDLSFVAFDNCQLNDASFVDAKLRGAAFVFTDVTGADFSGADLSGVDMSPAKGWAAAKCSPATRMPEGWVCDEGAPYPASAIFPQQ